MPRKPQPFFGTETRKAHRAYLTAVADYAQGGGNAPEVARAARKMIRALNAEERERRAAGTLTAPAARKFAECRQRLKSALAETHKAHS